MTAGPVDEVDPRVRDRFRQATVQIELIAETRAPFDDKLIALKQIHRKVGGLLAATTTAMIALPDLTERVAGGLKAAQEALVDIEKLNQAMQGVDLGNIPFNVNVEEWINTLGKMIEDAERIKAESIRRADIVEAIGTIVPKKGSKKSG